MELRHLEVLVNLAHHGGFSAAAKALSSTQPTISKAIRQLEHDCGTVLVERLGQGIRLTDAGDLVVRSGIAMLAERERLKAELAGLQGLLTGRLRLGVPALGSASLFAPLVAKFRNLYPQIEIDLQQHGSERLEEAVKSGEIEMGATLYPVRKDFDWQLVCEEPLLALLPAGHPLVGRGKVKLRELAGNPFILFEQGFVLNGRILAACRKRGIVLTEAARGANADFTESCKVRLSFRVSGQLH